MNAFIIRQCTTDPMYYAVVHRTTNVPVRRGLRPTQAFHLNSVLNRYASDFVNILNFEHPRVYRILVWAGDYLSPDIYVYPTYVEFHVNRYGEEPWAPYQLELSRAQS